MSAASTGQVIASAPEQGQLVTVRQRRYVATDVNESALPDGALTPVASSAEHLVTLSCLEDDALGEELQVIWEFEPGARVLEKVDLLPDPDGVRRPGQARRLPRRRPLGRRLDRRRDGSSRRRSVAASTSRTTSSTRSCGRSRCRGSTC